MTPKESQEQDLHYGRRGDPTLQTSWRNNQKAVTLTPTLRPTVTEMPAANAADDFCNNARGAPGPSRSFKLSCCYFVITFLMHLTEMMQLWRRHSQYNQISTSATFSMRSKAAFCLLEVRMTTKSEQFNEQTMNND